jgi:hypothetical protein
MTGKVMILNGVFPIERLVSKVIKPFVAFFRAFKLIGS